MTTPDPSPFGDAAEADVVEQQTPLVDVEDPEGGAWRDDSERVADDRDWEANEADLIEQAIDVPDDDADFDR